MLAGLKSKSFTHPESNTNSNIRIILIWLTCTLPYVISQVMGVPAKLTERQIKFAELLVYNEGRLSPAECAKEAGYGEAARIRAYELQNPKKYPLVVNYIGELREENQKKYAVTFERHITELAKIRKAAMDKGAFSAATNAEVARGKAAGLYIEQKIIRTGKLDDLSADELETRLKTILNEQKKYN